MIGFGYVIMVKSSGSAMHGNKSGPRAGGNNNGERR